MEKTNPVAFENENQSHSVLIKNETPQSFFGRMWGKIKNLFRKKTLSVLEAEHSNEADFVEFGAENAQVVLPKIISEDFTVDTVRKIVTPTSDGKLKIPEVDFIFSLNDFIDFAKDQSTEEISVEKVRAALLISEGLTGNYSVGMNFEKKGHVELYKKREALHELIKEKFPDLDLADKSSVQKFIDGGLETETAPKEEVSELQTEELPTAA